MLQSCSPRARPSSSAVTSCKDSSYFVEIVQPDPESHETRRHEWIECYVLTDVDPKSCGALARDLNAALPLRAGRRGGNGNDDDVVLVPPGSDDGSSPPPPTSPGVPPPLPNMDHLKRIRRRAATSDELFARELEATTAPSRAMERGARPGGGMMPTTTDRDEDDVVGGGTSDHRADSAASSMTTTTRESIAANDHPPEKKRARKGRREGKEEDDDSKRRTKTTTTTTTSGINHTIRPWSLDVLVGSVAAVDRAIRSDDVDCIMPSPSPSSSMSSSMLRLLLEGCDARCGTIVRKSLPGRPAETRDELNSWNASVWPTLFFEERTTRYREEASALSHDEYRSMISGMTEAIDDAFEGRRQWEEWRRRGGDDRSSSADARDDRDIVGGHRLVGAVVMNPIDGSIVSRSSSEREMRGTRMNGGRMRSNGIAWPLDASDGGDASTTMTTTTMRGASWSFFPGEKDPLCTPVLLAIQGVSRRERQVALGSGGMKSEEFRAGQVSSRKGKSNRYDRILRFW
jgi:hypothetical protein